MITGSFADMVYYLTKKLLEPDKNLATKEIHDLVAANNLLYGIKYTGFSFRSHYLTQSGEIKVNLGWDPKLHHELEPRAIGLAERIESIQKDYDYISETFTLMTVGGRNWQDFRNNLPDCVIQLHHELYSIPRIHSVEYNLRTNARLQFRYQMLLPRLHAYSVMHLLT